MKTLLVRGLCLGFGLLLCSGAARAAVLFDNVSCGLCVSGGVDNSADGMGGSPIAGSFSTDGSSFSVTSVTVVLEGNPSSTGSFMLYLTTDNTLSPGTLIDTVATGVSDSTLSATLTSYTFSGGLPYVLDPRTTYWLVLAQDPSSVGDTTVGWSFDDGSVSGTGEAGQSTYSGGSTYPDIAGGYQMIITGNDISDTPEPASLVTIGAGLVGLGIARRRRKLSRQNQSV